MNPQALYNLSYGVYVITTWADGRATGCTANAAMQVTSAPATIAVSINHDNFTNECIARSGVFAVNILGENCNPAVIGNFGFKSGRDYDKFEAHEPLLKSCLPVVRAASAYIACKVIDKMESATHTVFLGEVTDADILNSDKPMTYAYYHNVIKGKAPKNAPTYRGD